ncbi:hypothetical protein [Agathobaculum sp.]|uniref:hypothetical protein n=1 Tax=Agathobaculum sp. TaxID=2048138 RepID=UPI002A7ED507|nr:hypothetical protein [Agathobaculum sp.]MDY3617779.1 hypothetical protein [Agathobaculum sp.]
MYNNTFSKIKDLLETLEADVDAAFEHPEEDSLKEMLRVLVLSDRVCMLDPLIAKLDTILGNVLLSPVERLRWMELLCKLMALHEQSRDLLRRSIEPQENT